MAINTEDTAGALSDKETKTAEGSAKNTISEGEYTEDVKLVINAANEYYGEDIKPDSPDYPKKLEGLISKDLLPKAERLGQFETANKKLVAIMTDEPMLSGILSDMGSGAPFMHALVRNVDPKTFEPVSEPDKAAWEQNNKIRMDRLSAKEARAVEIAANEEKSVKAIEDFVTAKGMADSDKAEFAKQIGEFLDRAFSGDITTDFLEALYWSLNRDKDLEEQYTLGNLAGKNERIAIEHLKQSDLTGDKLPNLSSAGGANDSNEETSEVLDPRVKSLDDFLSRGSILGNR